MSRATHVTARVRYGARDPLQVFERISVSDIIRHFHTCFLQPHAVGIPPADPPPSVRVSQLLGNLLSTLFTWKLADDGVCVRPLRIQSAV
ncbi:hypothetical protein AMELA_G00128870 [Ameiurus melas]|uniref:Uncharacterized protein n=1 Tax=Ameiurus melas TaxID=219545 RepID=A0A7J6AQN7_AMEME|nr:hypothetical protein AMELA_G00128870 [Ameiurus melas]